MRIILNSALRLAAFIAAGTAAGSGHAADLLRCTALDSATLTAEGKLSHEPQRYSGLDSFVVDTVTGMVRTGVTIRWHVVQSGAGTNDTVLTMADNAASAATDFIRIRQWADQPGARFVAFALSTLISGTCEPVT